jgi:hypothetical protein
MILDFVALGWHSALSPQTIKIELYSITNRLILRPKADHECITMVALLCLHLIFLRGQAAK